MRTVTLTIAAGFALAAAACSNNETGNNLSTDANLAEDTAFNDAIGGNAADLATPTDAAGFAAAVAASDLYEIESAKLAASKATSADLKSFAAQLRADHEKSTVALKAAAGRASPAVTVTPALDAEKQGMLDQLKAASGAEFDRIFGDQQMKAHQKALSLLQNYAANGDSQPLKDFATQATTVVQGHMEHLTGPHDPA